MARTEQATGVRNMPRLNNRTLACLTILTLAGCAAAPTSRPNAPSAMQEGPYVIPKQIRYSFTLRNSGGNLLEKPQFWTYLPVPQTAHQKVKEISANYPYSVGSDSLGNSTIHFDLKPIPPYGTTIVSVTVDLLMSGLAVAAAADNYSRFRTSEPYIESGDELIVALAKELKTNSPAETVQNDYQWVAKNIKSEYYVAEDRGARYALDTRTGDCTEISYLLTALYRAQQIAARPVGGYVFDGNGVMKPMDYHNWTEFYWNGAWQIADAQKGHFVDKQTEFVAMRVIATGESESLGSQRFAFAGEGLEVEMN